MKFTSRIVLLLSFILLFGCSFRLSKSKYESNLAPQSGQFFKCKMSSEIWVADCRKDSALAKMIATAVQGVVNQDSAELYLVLNDHHFQQLEDTGREYIVLNKDIQSHETGLQSLLNKYLPRFSRIYVWDTQKDWTWNLALMLSSQHKGLPLTREYADFIIRNYHWQGEVIDLSDKWKSKAEAYDWAISELMPRCHDNILFSVGLRDDWKVAPWTLYDYAVASRGFSFWLDDAQKDEQQIIRDICRAGQYRPGAIVMGYAKSGDDLLATVNNYGIGYVVSDYYANGSFWSAYPNRSFSQPKGKARRVKPGKIYVSIIFSDGDNLQFDQNALYLMWKNDSLRGTIPVGTTMAAGLQEINPFLLEWYYKHKTGIAYKNGVIIMNQGEHIWKEGELYNALIKVKPKNDEPVFVNVYPIAASYGQGGIAKLKREIDRLEKACPGVYEYLLPKDLAASAARYFEKKKENNRKDIKDNIEAKR